MSDVPFTSKNDLTLVSGLTKLGNGEGKSWVTLTEAEAAAVCAELSKLHSEHLEDIERMDRAATAMEAYQAEIKRLSAVETRATPERLNITVSGQPDFSGIEHPECWTGLSVNGHEHAILVVTRMEDGTEVKHAPAVIALLTGFPEKTSGSGAPT